MPTTHALLFNEIGEPRAVLSLEQIEVSEPGASQVTVTMEASPIDPTDLGYVAGRYALRPTVPGSSAGQSGVGRIAAIGSGVADHQVGERVLVIPTGEQLVWQQQLNVEAVNVVTVDGDADPVQLATVGVNQMTAYQLLEHRELQSGDWIAQTAANSAVGRSVTALARQRGLRTVEIVRRPEAIELVNERAEHVFVADDQLEANLAATLGDERLALVLAATGGAAVTTLTKALRRGGIVTSYAAVDGQPITLPIIVMAEPRITGFWIVNWIRDTPRDAVADAYRTVAGLVADGTLHTEISATHPLDHHGAAIDAASDPATAGKVVLTF